MKEILLIIIFAICGILVLKIFNKNQKKVETIIIQMII